MRMAILSDVHANPLALEAVLADVEERGGTERYWVLGDLVSPGYDPGSVLRRLTALPEVAFVRGNTDRYTLGDVYPHLSVAQTQADPEVVTDDDLAALLRGCGADLVCVGHTHRPLERRVGLPEGEVHVVNVGAVAGLMEEPCGSYALLEADAGGYEVAVHRVAYDREAARRAEEEWYLPRPGAIR